MGSAAAALPAWQFPPGHEHQVAVLSSPALAQRCSGPRRGRDSIMVTQGAPGPVHLSWWLSWSPEWKGEDAEGCSH